MFNDDDADKIANMDNLIPDGIIDGSQYAMIVSNIVGYLSEVEKGDYISGITWVMRCVNECYDPETNQVSTSRSTDVATAMSYVLLTMLDCVEDEALSEFIRIQKEEVIPELIESSTTIPYYDVMSDNAHDFLEGIDEDN